MSQQICYTLANGQRVCIPLSRIMPRILLPFTDPRRLELERILVGATQQDLVSLVKMQQIAVDLSPKLRESMQTQIEQSASQLDLPKGVTIHFEN